MIKFIHPRTGKPRYYSKATVEAGLVPKVLLRERNYPKAATEPTAEPTREDMIAFLESKNVRVNPRIGDDKLKARYHENQE